VPAINYQQINQRDGQGMGEAIAYLGLGTNLGDRLAQLGGAIDALGDIGTVGAVSNVYESAPMYVTDQPNFMNMCVGLKTALGPKDLLAALKLIEVTRGRVQTFRNGPRAIDIDILLMGDLVLDLPHLSIPHIAMAERSFVLAPLSEIAAEILHPRTAASIAQLRRRLGDEGITCIGPLTQGGR
jgi:2-amino-4-hydroxy-6-hydroxymethyldihydropteridine diphosphokinase